MVCMHKQDELVDRIAKCRPKEKAADGQAFAVYSLTFEKIPSTVLMS